MATLDKVIDYFRQNQGKYPLEVLKQQLAKGGVPREMIEAAAQALAKPVPGEGTLLAGTTLPAAMPAPAPGSPVPQPATAAPLVAPGRTNPPADSPSGGGGLPLVVPVLAAVGVGIWFFLGTPGLPKPVAPDEGGVASEGAAAAVAPLGAAPAGGAPQGGAHSLPLIPEPLSITAGTVTGAGKERVAVVKITNLGAQAIKRLVFDMLFRDGSGKVENSVAHTHRGFSGFEGNLLPPGATFDMEVGKFFMTDKTVSVDGRSRDIEYADGGKWPRWEGGRPARAGQAPVSAALLGVIGKGDQARALIGLFNDEDRPVRSVQYSYRYLDRAGQETGKGEYGRSGDKPFVEPGGDAVMVLGNEAPPPGTSSVEVKMTKVVFSDKTEWEPGPAAR